MTADRPFSTCARMLLGVAAALGLGLAPAPLPETPVAAPAPSASRLVPSRDVLDEATRWIARKEYELSRPTEGAGWVAPNRHHDLRARWSAGALTTTPRVEGEAWRFTWETATFGRLGVPTLGAVPPVDAETVTGRRLEWRRGPLVEWYVNDEAGLEQGFTLTQRPAGDGEIVIDGRISGLTPALASDGQSVVMKLSDGREALRIANLVVTDARGLALPARFELRPGTLRLVTDDRNATYPVVIDPLMVAPSWTAESNQANAQFGTAVATAGDIIGTGFPDGYDDVLVGAPFWDSGTKLDVGAVFLWKGGIGGLTPNPGSGLPSNAAWWAAGDEAGAHLGTAVAAGDFNGDGVPDVAAGADAQDTGSSGGISNQGMVLVWNSSLTGSGPVGGNPGSPTTATWKAFSLQANARLGNALAAGDIDGDGRAELFAGAFNFLFYPPTTQGGAVFMWRGSALGLKGGVNGTPANADWKYGSDHKGAELGRALATGGDVNSDGIPDLAVGAPRWRDPLTDASQIDEGGAFVFYGKTASPWLSLTPDWRGESNQGGARFGQAVAVAGDMSCDAIDDLAIGASGYSNGQTGEGLAFLFLGSITGPSHPHGFPAIAIIDADWYAESNQASAQLGYALDFINTDCGPCYNLVVGAPTYMKTLAGEGMAFEWAGTPALGAIANGAPCPMAGVTCPDWSYAGGVAAAKLGSAVARAGDVNGDGGDDAIIGLPFLKDALTDEGGAVVFEAVTTGDSDMDGVADCADACPGDPNKTAPGFCGCGNPEIDGDMDGSPDCVDGCPTDPNKSSPGQCGCNNPETGDSDMDGVVDCADGCPNDPNKTSPGICGCGVPDTDSDMDGIPNCNDGCPNDPNKVAPANCGCGVPETGDTDMDGTFDCNDTCPNDPNKTSPGTCGCGVLDTDSDMDGTPNCNDTCPNDPNKTSPGTCGCGTPDTDSDMDGTPNCNDGCPNDANKTAPGQCGCGVVDTDSDMDGTADCNDTCPNDANKTAPGQCGCGVADTDSDMDGTANCNDGCPNDANKTAPGQCGCGILDTDNDMDGTANCNDGCPNDANKTAPGVCGCGVPDTDNDMDGTANCNDGCPNDANKTAPGACGCGVPDTDMDMDGTLDCNDGCPNDANKTAPGACGCGVPDTDSDMDGTPNCNDLCPNDANKTAPGQCGCGVADTDSDMDGTANCNDLCPNDANKTAPGQCGCGVADTDSDMDGTANCNDLCPNDANKTAPGICGCGTPDTDSDMDGTADCNDGCPNDANKTAPGQCGCGNPDTDSDMDGIANCNDGCPNDPNKVAPGQCGCGNPETGDSDMDGTADCVDGCPNDPNKVAPGQCGCGVSDADSDMDGAADCTDSCPFDPSKTDPMLCGCGTADGNVQEAQILTEQPTPVAGNMFSRPALDGDTAVIGTPQAPAGADNTGQAFAWVRDMAGTWTQQQQLVKPGAANTLAKFGDFLSLSGDTVAIAAPGDMAVYIFLRTAGVWSLQQTIPKPGDASTTFPTSLALNGDTLVIGDQARNDGVGARGGAYVFVRSGVLWTQQTVLLASDRANGDEFGVAVSIDGDTAVVGADQDDDGGSNTGSVYFFLRTAGVWAQQGKLSASDKVAGDKLGVQVDVSGNTAIATTTLQNVQAGAGYVFVRSGTVWSQQAKLTASDAAASDHFGVGASVFGNVVAIGAQDNDDTGSNSGSAYVYVRQANNTWTEVTKLTASDATSGDKFGLLDVSGQLVLVGAPNAGVPGKANAGKVYVYELCPCLPGSQDTDNDGTPDCQDGCPLDEDKTSPGTCGCGVPDDDSDMDGTADCNDQCPNDANKTAPGVCGCGNVETGDSDMDGTADCNELCPNDPNKTSPGTCGCGVPDTDSDMDGTADCNDLCPNDANKTAPGQCGCGNLDTDSDMDGTANCNDGCPNDPNKAGPGQCGCGNPDTDSDMDGAADCIDLCPNDPNKSAPGACGCGAPDTDGDMDGTPDCQDGCPSDANKTEAGLCGCGHPDGNALQAQILIEPAPLAGDHFSRPAVDGDTTVIGAPDADPAGQVSAGQAFVFVRDGSGTWLQQAQLLAPAPVGGAKFGDILSLSGNTAAIGAPGSTSVYMFLRTGTSWALQQTITKPADASASFPTDLALAGDTLIVGDESRVNSGGKIAGGAYVFVRSGTVWTQQALLEASDAAAGDQFGHAVSVSGDSAVVAADQDDDGASNTGSVYFYLRTGTSWGSQGKATATDRAAGDKLGARVDIAGSWVIATTTLKSGGIGAGYVFQRTGTTWAQQAKLTPSDGAALDHFGIGAAISGSGGRNIAIGSQNDDDDGSNSGSAYAYVRRANGTWTEVVKLEASDAAAGDTFGLLDLSGTRVVIGSPNANGGGKSNAGKAYVFELCPCGIGGGGDSDMDGTADCDDGCPNDPNKVAPGQCGCGNPESGDSDMDGSLDCADGCPNDPNKSAPGQCGCGNLDTDSDMDGTANCNDLCPNDANKTAPGQCGCGIADTDSDMDGTANCNDGCPNDGNKTAPGICGCGVSDTDSDMDGTANCNDGCPNDANKTAPGICGCGMADTDSDMDGTANCNDGCPNDGNKTAPGICGCGVPDTDSDMDGTANCNDGCPNDANKTAPGQCGCGIADTDGDMDGTANCNDGCPNDANKTAPGACGCGVSDADNDMDGFPDCNDLCPNDPNKTAPGQCGCGNPDTDSDMDGTANCNDGCPNDANKTAAGQCGCGVADTDSDMDGTANCNDGCPNDANKTAPGACGCGVAETGDSDMDGTADCNDLCPNDANKTAPGVCGCGVPETGDSDMDGTADCNDGCPNDANKTAPGQCGCGNPDTDSDMDGTANCNDGCPNDANKTAPGACGCGNPETGDSDMDGTADCNDLCPNDMNKTAPGACGCGNPETGDSDMDGTADCNDGCPNDPLKTAPGACGCGLSDDDGDMDGFPDCNDTCPNDPNKGAPGQCGCGIPDTDSDMDGVADCNDGCPNDGNKTAAGVCGCGIPDTDGDMDGTEDCNDGCPNDPNKTSSGQCGCGIPDDDADMDGTADCNDGCPNDPNKSATGQCGCGNPDSDTDMDGTADCNDGCPNDGNKTAPGTCGCGFSDDDNDMDGFPDCNDLCPNDPNKVAPGACGCGVPDTDSDMDGTPDCNDLCPNDPNKVAPGTCGCGNVETPDSDSDGAADCIDGCPNDPGKTAPGACGCGVADTDSDMDGLPDCNDSCPNDPDNAAEVQILTEASPGNGNHFSRPAIDGDTAVIGAPDYPAGTSNAGSAFVFVYSGTWSQQQQLLSPGAPNTSNKFGDFLALSGDTVAVAAPGDDAVYIFVRSAGVWSHQQTISKPGDASTAFPTSLALNADTLVIGDESRVNVSARGGAYVFLRTAGVWAQQQVLLASDGATGDQFGHAVAVQGDTAVVSADQDDDLGGNSGSVYYFVRSAGTWTQQGKSTAADGSGSEKLGQAVDISGNSVVATTIVNNGGRGAGYVFFRTGVTWTQQAKLTASDGAANDHLGLGAAISGDKVALGAQDDDDPAGAGSAYVFARSGTTWTQQGNAIRASDKAASDQFGYLDLSGSRLFVGAPNHNASGVGNSGQVYVYELCP